MAVLASLSTVINLGSNFAFEFIHTVFVLMLPMFSVTECFVLFLLQIREETDTKIELPSEGSDSDVIVITGHKAQVEAARDHIIAIQNELVRVLIALLLFCRL